MSTLGLVEKNGKVKAEGNITPKEKIKTWIEEAVGKNNSVRTNNNKEKKGVNHGHKNIRTRLP